MTLFLMRKSRRDMIDGLTALLPGEAADLSSPPAATEQRMRQLDFDEMRRRALDLAKARLQTRMGSLPPNF